MNLVKNVNSFKTIASTAAVLLVIGLAPGASASLTQQHRQAPPNARQRQWDMLRTFGISDAPPDLSSLGLGREDDLYFKTATGEAATAAELVSAIEMMRTQKLKRDDLKDDAQRLGALELDASAADKLFDNSAKSRTAALDELKSPDPLKRDVAAHALGNILARLKRSNKTEDWGPYVKAAPSIMTALALSPDQLDPARAVRRILWTNINLSNLYEYADVARIVSGYTDARALMIIMSANDLRYVGEWTGLHSDDFSYYYARLKTLTGNKISALFEDPRMQKSTKLSLLARFVDFRQIEDVLRSDQEMLRLLPGLMFVPADDHGLRPSGVWTIDDVARRVYGTSRFYQTVLDALPGLPPEERRAAAHYLNRNAIRLSAAQKEALARYGTLPEPPQTAPYHAKWPKDTFAMYLIMSKAYGYGDTLKARYGQKGFSVVSDDRASAPRRIELVRKVGSEVRLHLQVFATDEEHDWWSPDHDKLTQSVVAALADPNAQAVMFRGHAGDYAFEPVSKTRARDKVFIDLSCYSDFRSQSAMKNCRDCSYFGTTGTTNGPHNDAVMSRIVEDLAEHRSPSAMLEGFRNALPDGKYYMTGSGSQSEQWSRALAAR